MRLVHLVAAALLALGARGAAAHAFLDHADPAVGATVTSPPKLLKLWFTETVEPAFSKVELTTSDGTPVPTGRAALSPSDPSELDLPLTSPLPAGSYKVSWHVVSTDTHRTEGDFTFEVTP